MRIVFDTSVLVAAHVARAGVCAQLVEQVLDDSRHSVCGSDFILDEFGRKLLEKFGLPAGVCARALTRWREIAEIVAPAEIAPKTCRDPTDLAILGTAVAAKAELLVSVDKDLLALRSFSGIRIVKPGEAFALIR